MLTYRELAVRKAVGFIGITEKPAGSNRGVWVDKWNRDACGTVGVFWCASFVHGMFKAVGLVLPGGASVGNIRAWAASAGHIVKRPRRGDIACFEFGEGTYAFDDHTGLVERVLALRTSNGKFTGWIQTIEGNTTADGKTGSQSNGGCVARKRRWVRGIGAQFVRVPGSPKT